MNEDFYNYFIALHFRIFLNRMVFHFQIKYKKNFGKIE